MAKKRARRPNGDMEPGNGDLGWGDAIPEAVEAAAEKYVKALRAKNKAAERVNTDKESLIETMRQHDIKRLRIDEGAKVLVLEEKDVVKIEKAKEPEAVG